MAFLDPRVWLALLVAFVAGYASGFAHHYLRAAKAEAAVEARQETTETTVQTTVATVDESALNALKTKLTASDRRAASLQARLEEYRRANPPSADCRLPDGLRDAINHDLDPEGAR